MSVATRPLTINKKMKNKKGISTILGTLIIIILLIVAIVIIWKVIESINKEPPAPPNEQQEEILHCHTSKYYLESGESIYKDLEVEELVVLDYMTSRNYWKKICGKIVEDEFSEVLNQSENIGLYINYGNRQLITGESNDQSIMLYCEYSLRWTDTYEEITSDKKAYLLTDFMGYLSENPQEQYNYSDVIIYNDRIINYNKDYDVSIIVKWEC